MARLHDALGISPDDLPHVPLHGPEPTPVRSLGSFGGAGEVWIKDESAFGTGGWGGNKVRKLEWIIPEIRRRGRRTLFTVGGIGTHWGLAATLYGAEHGLRTVLGLVDQPIDDHVREQWDRLRSSGAVIHRFADKRRLMLAAPLILARHLDRGRPPCYLPAGGSSPMGALGYVEAAFEIADHVEAGVLPEPGTVVTAVGSGGTAAGLALGLRLAGLRSRVFGVVVNDALRLDDRTVSRLARDTAALLRRRGGDLDDVEIWPDDLTMRGDWLGETYGAATPEGLEALQAATAEGLELEPVYTAKALAAIRALGTELDQPVLWMQTHGPR